MGSTGHFIGCDWNWRGNTKDYLDTQYTDTKGTPTYRVLASATKGNVYYAALERTSVGTGQRDVFALVQPYVFSGKGYNRQLIVRDQDETMGPVEAYCPAKVLKLLTDPLNENAETWRQRCWANIAAKKRKQRTTPKVGDLLVFEEPFRFSGHGSAATFVVTSWGKRKRFVARGEQGSFPCRLSRWALSHDYVVVDTSETT